jgi:Zn-dependent protease with chaperone function
MPEGRRASAALAALVLLATAAGALLVYHLVHFLPASVEAVARMCRLPGAMAGMSHEPAAPTPALLSLGLLVAGAVFATARLGLKLRSTGRLMAGVAALPADASASPAAVRVVARSARLGFPAAPVVAYLGRRPEAFTTGLLRPRIVVSEAVVEGLSDAELDALLLHEAAHARRHDPLRLLVAGFCRDLVFFLPLGHALFRLAVEAQERAADDEAAATAGPLEVASALLTYLRMAGPRSAAGVAPAAAGADPEARIRRLLDAPSAGASRVRPRLRLATTALISAVLIASLGGAPAQASSVARADSCTDCFCYTGSRA